jgi:hypothetical protein
MFGRIWLALRTCRMAMLEAEALVYRFGSRGIEMAQAFSRDRSVAEERREHYRRVAAIAERRQELLQDLDTATKYAEQELWRSRRGSMIQ